MLIERLAEGGRTCSEQLGHREFIMGYKHFEATGPSCLPSAA
jgi:altronate hydrolase